MTAVELRGHGESEGKRGHVDRWEQYLDDVRAAAETIDGPVVLLGHSMGLVALDLAIDGLSNGIEALVLSDPNVAVAIEAPAVKVMGAKVLSRLLPRLSSPTSWMRLSSVGTSPWSTSTRGPAGLLHRHPPMVHRDVVVARARCRERDTLRDAAADAARRRDAICD